MPRCTNPADRFAPELRHAFPHVCIPKHLAKSVYWMGVLHVDGSLEGWLSSNSEKLKRALELSTVTSFSDRAPASAVVPNGRSVLAQQLKQVARVIRASTTDVIEAERDAFFVSLGAFDTHHYPLSEGKLQQVETGLAAFKAEMEAQGVWDQVTILVRREEETAPIPVQPSVQTRSMRPLTCKPPLSDLLRACLAMRVGRWRPSLAAH